MVPVSVSEIFEVLELQEPFYFKFESLYDYKKCLLDYF